MATTTTNGWKAAFTAFLDRRALIMLFLGFSAGIPILLIFSSLSLWLGEAGIDKSAVTFFSWAALGYSFKFVWAPLVDELPVPYLTKMLGRRRAWLLIAQLLIVVAICIMAFSDPAQGPFYLIQMAAGAVLLGFSAATQDIVIDAYRIELAETQLQTVLASTYNAGYRIGMIVAGAGALFLAAGFGTANGNYIYEAWKYTYLIMAAVMGIGIVTTLVVREPQVERIYKNYKRSDYYRLVLVFFIAVIAFVLSYIYSGHLTQKAVSYWSIQDNILLFLIEALRFLCATAFALAVGAGLVHLRVVNSQMAKETWVNPVLDFFKRYGTKLALVLLLLIGFYRISDIIAGVISNVFYQDLNFSKEQIAEAVKVYGVIFSLLGGFVGGLMAQRINIMKLLFIGAILASSTNLIFIGLVKSGQPLDQVRVQVGEQQFYAQTDEVGYFSIPISNSILFNQDKLKVSAQYLDHNSDPVIVELPYLHQSGRAQIQILPIGSNNQLTTRELRQSVVIKGQLNALDVTQLNPVQPIVFELDHKQIPAKLDAQHNFSAVFNAQDLENSSTRLIKVKAISSQGEVIASSEQLYQVVQTLPVTKQPAKADIDLRLDPVVPIASSEGETKLSGKVIKSYSSHWLYFAIVVDNLASGLAGAAFIAFLSSLTSVSFTAVQYAIFSSLMTLTPKLLGGYSGTMVTHMGYPHFFLMTTLIGIPILFLVIWVARLLKQHQPNS